MPYARNPDFVGRVEILEQLRSQLGHWQDQFWVHASNAERFRQSYTSIAQKCQVPGYNDPKMDVLLLVRRWLNREDCGQWLMVIDNADDTQLFFSQALGHIASSKGNLGQHIPECPHGSVITVAFHHIHRTQLWRNFIPKRRHPISSQTP